MTHAEEKAILVVDDEPDVRKFLATIVKDAGFQVSTAVDGVDALEQVARRLPDLMILDMVMPRKSGIKVIRTLRENPEWAKLPVIVVTAHAHDEFGSEDIKEFNAFTSGLRPRYTMEKPVTPAKLIRAIGDILDVDLAAPEDEASSNENADLIKLISKSNPETLAKIREVLADK